MVFAAGPACLIWVCITVVEMDFFPYEGMDCYEERGGRKYIHTRAGLEDMGSGPAFHSARTVVVNCEEQLCMCLLWYFDRSCQQLQA